MTMIRQTGDATLAVARHAWEANLDARASLLVDDGNVTLIADASIYYQDDLREKLLKSGTRLPNAPSAAEAILAAYNAWGDREIGRASCRERVEDAVGVV